MFEGELSCSIIKLHVSLRVNRQWKYVARCSNILNNNSSVLTNKSGVRCLFQQHAVMEYGGYRMHEVSESVDVKLLAERPNAHSPPPVLSTNVSCDLEDILTDVST